MKIFQMNLAATGTLETEAKVQYICTLVHGYVLRRFDLVSTDTKNRKTLLDVDYLLKVLEWYCFP